MYLRKDNGIYLRKDKGRIWKLVGIFFAGMVLFTLLSRAAYQHGIAVVTTAAPSSGAIAHTVQLTGKALQNQEQAVTTVAGLRVARVCVNEGQQVAQGDVLFSLDLDYLEKTILTQKQNMEKQRLSIQDAWSQSSASQQRRSNAKAQAEENYRLAVSQAQTKLERAARGLARAKAALENYYNGITEDKAQEEALLYECQEAKSDYDGAVAALEQLRQELEEAIQEAIRRAEEERENPTLPPVEPALPLTQEEIDDITQAVQLEYDQRLLDAQLSVEQAGQLVDTARSALEAYYQSGAEDTAQEELLLLECREAESGLDAARTALEQLQWELEEAIREAIRLAEEERLTEDPAIPEETEPPSPPLTQEEIDAIADAVRLEYAQRLSDAESAAQQAKQAMDAADAALEAYRQGQQSGSSVHSEQELLDAVENAQDTYDDALAALENTKTTYGRAISSASLPDGTSSTAQSGQITYDQMEFTLSKLEELLDAEGIILSPVDGIVLRCRVQTGEKTSDTAAMLLADLSQGCKFSGLITEEQSKYIGVGDRVTLQASSTGKRYEDLPVTTISTSQEAGGGYRLTVQLPANTLSHGAAAELRFTRKSQVYSCCVPVSALHLDAQNRPYVLVMEQVNTVLGTQLQARKVSVTVLEQNETTAALAEGMLNSKQEVIVGSDRAVDSGSRVRVG